MVKDALCADGGCKVCLLNRCFKGLCLSWGVTWSVKGSQGIAERTFVVTPAVPGMFNVRMKILCLEWRSDLHLLSSFHQRLYRYFAYDCSYISKL